MSSCIESFLRGTYPVIQLFAIRSGVLKNIVKVSFPPVVTYGKDIVSIDEQDNTNLQTSFDLLGEILKFNKRTILIFESSVSKGEFELVCRKVLSNIIDSNVLARALVLSLHRFSRLDREACAKERAEYVPFSVASKLIAFIEENSRAILRSLINSVSPTTISQTSTITSENGNRVDISCINTAIIMLIFEKGARRLEKTLRVFYEDDLSKGTKLIDNLKLVF